MLERFRNMRPAKLQQLYQKLLCGFITILVLRGTIGAGKFGTPAQDLREIREHLPSMHFRRSTSHRVLAEAHEEDVVNRDSASIIPTVIPLEEEKIATNFTLGAKITDWDTRRAGYSPGIKNRVLLVTGSQPSPCENPVGDHYLLKSLKNKVDYTRLHGIQLFYNMAYLEDQLSGYWAKIPLIRRLMLANPEIEWIWWMDSDAFFTDMNFTIPFQKYANHNMILHGWDELVYDRRSWIGLNTGSFLIRNCQWSLDLLDAWAPMGPKGRIRDDAGKILSRNLTGRPQFEADDQSALVFLLANHREIWGDRVFLENSYYLHGYWEIIVDKFEEFSGGFRPFVTHFVGCKPCGKFGDYPLDKCLQQMERAFNFGDNQVINRLGFRHGSLGTSKVVKTLENEDNSLSLDELKVQSMQQQQVSSS